MVGQVNVKREALQISIRCCDAIINELNESSKFISNKYQAARDAGFRDEKSRRTGMIVDSCVRELKSPLDELAQCKEKLIRILDIVVRYEDTNL